jgi:hypothetical protein
LCWCCFLFFLYFVSPYFRVFVILFSTYEARLRGPKQVAEGIAVPVVSIETRGSAVGPVGIVADTGHTDAMSVLQGRAQLKLEIGAEPFGRIERDPALA